MKYKYPHIGKNVKMGRQVDMGSNVVIGSGSVIESGAVLYDGVRLGENSYVGRNVILGERLRSYYQNPRAYGIHPCVIGDHSILRTGTLISGDVKIGSHFETGPYVTIREKTVIGHHSRFGNFSDIQGFCTIGNHVSGHSNVTIGQYSVIRDYVWLHPFTILLNDRFPPTGINMKGPTIGPYSVLGACSILFPSVHLGKHVIVGAGAVVKENAKDWQIVNSELNQKTMDSRKLVALAKGKLIHPYPWPEHRNPIQR